MMRNVKVNLLACLTGLILALPTLAQDRLGAMGIGVADLDASSRFYAEALGLEVQRTYELGYLNEIVLGYPDSESAVVVLMNWPEPARVYNGENVKLVFYVDDPAGVIERIRALGGEILREATPIELLDGLAVGLAKDPDHYVVEVVEQQP